MRERIDRRWACQASNGLGYRLHVLVFVHGVPEVSALWDDVRAELGRESVAVSLPGFGCPRPDGFGATKDEYVDWLCAELDELEQPIDLVGHDWGAALTIRVATKFGDRLHSWIADGASGQHPEYVWHDFAKIWQTPGDGERFFADQLAATPEDIAAVYESMDVPPDKALLMAGWPDETMTSCILDLYRSATPNNYATWGADLGVTKAPGLVLIAPNDPFLSEPMSLGVASMLGARVERLEGLGHWWAFQDPARGAAAIGSFLDSLE
jgi:pimeloyl-ACP methyl ester carboxylesterase